MVIIIFPFSLLWHCFTQSLIISLHLYTILAYFLDQLLMKLFKSKSKTILAWIRNSRNHLIQSEKDLFLEKETTFQPIHRQSRSRWAKKNFPTNRSTVIPVECIDYHVFRTVEFVMFAFRIMIIIVHGVRRDFFV